MLLGFMIFFILCEIAFGYMLWVAITATIPSETIFSKIVVAFIITIVLATSVYNVYLYLT